jgi:hypothetical protein
MCLTTISSASLFVKSHSRSATTDETRCPGVKEREEYDMERVAECHCGQLKAIATGEPERVYLCHCRSCQRRTGAVMHSGARWLKSEVRIEGQDKIFGRMADSGFEIRFHFCPNCGSSVFWEGDRGSDYYGIAVGCFADPTFPPPVYSAYEEAMHHWVGVATAREHYPRARPANAPLTR